MEVELNKEVLLDSVAASELRRFIENSSSAQNDQAVGLRVKVIGGGCAGFQYSLALDHAKDGDMVFDSEGLQLIVDEVSLNFVAGSTITYRDDINESGFQVINPRAVSACGCGSSFAMQEA